MSDGSEASELNEKQIGMPPVFLLGGFLILATAGSAFFVMPAEQPTTTVSATLVIPSGENAAGQPYAIEESPAEARPSKATVHAAEQPDPETARRNRLIVGNWQQDYFGKRTLSVKADGTATMTILPSSLWQVAFGPKIDLTMFWSVKDGHLDYGINGGAPADKVKMAAKTWGDHWVEKIIELDEQKLDLLSVDGSTHSIWERAPVGPQAEFRPGKSSEK